MVWSPLLQDDSGGPIRQLTDVHHLNYSMQWIFSAVHCFSAHRWCVPNLLFNVVLFPAYNVTFRWCFVTFLGMHYTPLCVPWMVNLLKFFDIENSPEGASPLCTGVTPGSISKSQGGLGWPMHWSKRDYRSLNPSADGERDMRHVYLGKQPHHCKALWITKG